MAVVTIIGAGMMGSALAFPTVENGHDVRLVGTPLDRDIIDISKKTMRHPKFETDFPESPKFYQIEELPAAIRGAELVIAGVSSFGVEWFGDYVLPLLADGVPLLSVTKGLWDTPDHRLISNLDVWAEKLSKLGKSIPLCGVGGACISYDLTKHDQTVVSFCGEDMEVLGKLKELMETDYYHIRLTKDIIGTESAVALKNGYALGVALAIGLDEKYVAEGGSPRFNSQAALFEQSMAEMYRLLSMQKAVLPEALFVGIGDLYVTINRGRNRTIGVLLGRGLDIDEAKKALREVTLESLVVLERTAKVVRARIAAGELSEGDFPLLLHIDDIILRHSPVNIPFDAFV